MSHSLKSWIATTRYWSFSVSALPVVAAVAYLASTRGVYAIGWLNAALSVVGVVLFHAAGNLLSDVGDYRSGADSEEAYAVPTLVKHEYEARGSGAQARPFPFLTSGNARKPCWPRPYDAFPLYA